MHRDIVRSGRRKTSRRRSAQEGDYVLALKENQPHLREDVQSLFTWADNWDYEAMVHAYHKDTHKGHGRLETRECWTISDPSCIAMLASGEEWANLRTVVRVRAERQVGATRTTEVRYYISSLPDAGPRTAEQVLQAVRSHWSIENCLHWVLDMAFREDESRVRKDHGDENLAVLRHIALNLLRQDTATRLGIHGKRLCWRANTSPAYSLLKCDSPAAAIGRGRIRFCSPLKALYNGMGGHTGRLCVRVGGESGTCCDRAASQAVGC